MKRRPPNDALVRSRLTSPRTVWRVGHQRKELLMPYRFRFYFLCLPILLFTLQTNAAEINKDIEDTMAGMKLGSRVEELTSKYHDIYKHQLMMGEVLYEACNQQPLEAFTFTEEPWSKGHITNIWVRKAEVSVCRDSTGGLPDYSMAPVTPRGLKLGDKEENVMRLYGTPTNIKTIPGGKKILTFQSKQDQKDVIVKNLVLYVEISNGTVSSFHLHGEMPGAKKPF